MLLLFLSVSHQQSNYFIVKSIIYSLILKKFSLWIVMILKHLTYSLKMALKLIINVEQIKVDHE
jgi:hypothetical protein